MELIVDTNAVSDFSVGDEAVLKRLRQAQKIYLPFVTIAEYRFGLLGSNSRRVREKWFNDLIRVWDVLPAGEQTATHYAEIRHDLKKNGRPIPSNDIWIAALAVEHGIPVLSRDNHFTFVGKIEVISW